jgi:tetratricopeptide (TPR) repeat protein/tRNA A-37 threonylcarbamoyl transferase component Bud32
MGVVYMAEDTHLGRRVAVKFLSQKSLARHDTRARFLREARAISVLSHPHIAAVYDYGEAADGSPFIVMELVEGRTIGELLHESELTLADAVSIVEQVAEALAEAHAHGIVHRDIKPSNIIVNDKLQVKVLDFGLAKQFGGNQSLDADPDARTLLNTYTQSGVVLGTPLYLSPEQAVAGTVDGRSDIFALGSLLYECAAGRPAFSGGSLLEIGAQVIHVDPPPPSTFNPRVPKQLDRITMKALAKNADARYQTADELRDELKQLADDLSHDNTRTQRIENVRSLRTASGGAASISEELNRPRLSIAFVILAVILTAATVWAAVHYLRTRIHQPTATAVFWYKAGLGALDDGTYFKASKALEQAVEADPNYALAHARLAEAWTELDYNEKAKDELLQVSSLIPDRTVLPEVDRLYLNAITSTVTRDFAGAIASYESIAKQVPNDAQVTLDLGCAYEKNEQADKAIEKYKEAAAHDPEYAPAYLRLGILYGRRQDLAQAGSAFDRADAIYNSLGNIEGQTEVLYQRGVLLTKLGKVPDARVVLQRALELARTTRNPHQQIRTLLQLSADEVAANDGAKGESLATDALNLARSNGMESLTARGLVDLGNAFFVRGDYQDAEKYFREAHDIAERGGSVSSQARALVMLGSLNMQLNRSDDAVRYSSEALALYQKGGYRKETSQALLLLGHANRLKGDYDAAMQAFQGQLDLADKTGDTLQSAASHEAIGSVLVQRESFPRALEHFDKKFEISKALGNQRGIAYGLMERGDVLWQLGRYDEARSALDEAAALASQSSVNKSLLADIKISQAEMLLSQKRFAEAREMALNAAKLAGSEAKDVTGHIKAIVGLAQSLSGARVPGRQLCEEALTEVTDLHDPWLISKVQLSLAQALFQEGKLPAARDSAVQAIQTFSKSGQLESEWRAWIVAARSIRAGGDVASAADCLARARACMSKLRDQYGAEAFAGYSSRPDIQDLVRLTTEQTG